MDRRLLLGYGGSESLQSPALNFGPATKQLMAMLVRALELGYDEDPAASRLVSAQLVGYGEGESITTQPTRAHLEPRAPTRERVGPRLPPEIVVGRRSTTGRERRERAL